MDAPIYSDMWKAWQDPHVPEYFNPTEVIIDKHADGAFADKPALLADEGTITFARLKQEMCRSANGLRQLGLPVESRILVFATDSLATIATWFGAVRSGIVPAGISELYKAHQLAYFLRDTAATALFIDAAQFSKLEEARDDLPDTLRHVIVNGDMPEHGFLRERGIKVVTHAGLVDGMQAQAAPLPRHNNDVTYMFYSGGTTAPPRASPTSRTISSWCRSDTGRGGSIAPRTSPSAPRRSISRMGCGRRC